MSTVLERLGTNRSGVLRDVFLIVFSILIAFGLDAWWSNEVERRTVSESLLAVRAELLDARLQLDTVMARNAASIESVTLWLTTPDDPPPLTFGMLYEPATGALDAVLLSGLLGEVQPIELRTLLAAWPGTLGSLEADGQNWLDVIRRIGARMTEIGLSAEQLSLTRTGTLDAEAFTRRMFADDHLRNLMAEAALSLGELQEELVLTSDRLDELLRQLPGPHEGEVPR